MEHLPDNVTLEDGTERLCFLSKVEKGVRWLDIDEDISVEGMLHGIPGPSS